MQSKSRRKWALPLGLGLGLLGLAGLARRARNKRRLQSFYCSKVVAITGGSSGLGFCLAERLTKLGAKVFICSRDWRHLENARSRLPSLDVFACDVSKQEDVRAWFQHIMESHSRIDVLINCAGSISMAPMNTAKAEDYKALSESMYLGLVQTTYEALACLKKSEDPLIINVTSIGGLVPVPHLAAYCGAKFAAHAFSQSSAMELRKEGIHVLSVAPGLMRTGSVGNALFPKGDVKEAKLFYAAAGTPLITLSAAKAARRILLAAAKKRRNLVLGAPAKLVHFFYQNQTALYLRLMTWVNEWLGRGKDYGERQEGKDFGFSSKNPLTKRAIRRYQPSR